MFFVNALFERSERVRYGRQRRTVNTQIVELNASV